MLSDILTHEDECGIYRIKKENRQCDCYVGEVAALEAELAFEKDRRIHWQDLTYYAMIMIDKVLGKGRQTTEDTFKEKCDELEAQVARLRELFTALRDTESQDEAYMIWEKLQEALDE